MLEGAQGTLLDLDHGTYPFVTSSNPIAGAAATGIGIGPTRIDEVLGVSKAYVTRVGAGPFPSEMDDEVGVKVRELGQEFGTVTGRERRPGWLDLVALRYAVRLNGITSLALTKLDVLSAFDALQVCVRYRLPDGTETPDFPAHQSDFHHAAPVMETVPGWGEPLDDCTTIGDLPGAARAYVSWSSARSTCRSGSSGREPHASRCSRRREPLGTVGRQLIGLDRALAIGGAVVAGVDSASRAGTVSARVASRRPGRRSTRRSRCETSTRRCSPGQLLLEQSPTWRRRVRRIARERRCELPAERESRYVRWTPRARHRVSHSCVEPGSSLMQRDPAPVKRGK